jgi:hypothetical protein
VNDEQGQVPGGDDDRRPSRRTLIAGAATGAAAVWAAPAILSLDVASAQSTPPCTTDLLAWQPGNLDTTNPVQRAVGSTAFVSISFDKTPVGTGTGSVISPGGAGQQSQLGGVTNLLQLNLTITTVGQFEKVTILFTTEPGGTIPSAVRNLRFTLLGIDQSGGANSSVDDVHLYGRVGGSVLGGVYTGGSYVPAAFTNVGADVEIQNGQSDSGGTYDLALAVSGPAAPVATSTAGNVDVAYAGFIDFLEIRYVGNGGTDPQLIGISDLSVCA